MSVKSRVGMDSQNIQIIRPVPAMFQNELSTTATGFEQRVLLCKIPPHAQFGLLSLHVNATERVDLIIGLAFRVFRVFIGLRIGTIEGASNFSFSGLYNSIIIGLFDLVVF